MLECMNAAGRSRLNSLKQPLQLLARGTPISTSHVVANTTNRGGDAQDLNCQRLSREQGATVVALRSDRWSSPSQKTVMNCHVVDKNAASHEWPP